MGYEVRIDSEETHIQSYTERSKDNFAQRLKESKGDYAVSFDLSPEIAQACFEEGIPYIAWCYDSPLKEVNGWFAAYPTTHIFVMDKQESLYRHDIAMVGRLYSQGTYEAFLPGANKRI